MATTPRRATHRRRAPNCIPAFGRHTILLVAEIVGVCLFHQPDLARALAIVLLYASGRRHRRRHRR